MNRLMIRHVHRNKRGGKKCAIIFTDMWCDMWGRNDGVKIWCNDQAQLAGGVAKFMRNVRSPKGDRGKIKQQSLTA